MYTYDLLGAVRAERLRLARKWMARGATHQAMFAYTEVLIRYAGTYAAEAAAQDLLELARIFEQEGKFYMALNIFRKIERWYGRT